MADSLPLKHFRCLCAILHIVDYLFVPRKELVNRLQGLLCRLKEFPDRHSLTEFFHQFEQLRKSTLMNIAVAHSIPVKTNEIVEDLQNTITKCVALAKCYSQQVVHVWNNVSPLLTKSTQ